MNQPTHPGTSHCSLHERERQTLPAAADSDGQGVLLIGVDEAAALAEYDRTLTPEESVQ
jgi:hypothetical protein